MNRIYLALITCVILLVLQLNTVTAQNTAITDEESYTPHSSAMLDVYSLSKGLLVPRLTSAQRSGISSPADGLLVYDTDADTYYYFANTAWHTIDAPSLWSENSDTIFITGVGKRYGVGTASPLAKLTVQGDATIASDEPLFEVKNSTGDVIFAVYENEVKVNFKEGVKGVKGGFAVGGLSGTKGDPIEYMRITPDSVRIYIDDSPTKAAKGGFAVGGLSGTKGGNQYFKLNDESATIYLNEPAKGVKGGFAVGGLSGTKGAEDFLTIERDSTRIYVNDALKDKAAKGGFAVGGLSGTKEGASFLNITPENYFIGHSSGNFTTGTNNSFFGFEAGYTNTTGYNNVFIGRMAGHSNVNGWNNMFIGNQSGFSNTSGEENTFIGLQSGYSNTTGRYNLFFGSNAGESNITGFENVIIGFWAGKNADASGNVMLGSWAGYANTSGFFNTFLGHHAGMDNTTGTNNTFVGYSAGGGGGNNVAVGAMSGILAKGYNNVFIGHQSARYDTIGNSNVIIGYRAGWNLKNGGSNVFIGNQAGYNETGSYKLYIDNSSTATPLIYGDFQLNNLVFNGDVNITGTLTGGKSVEFSKDVFAADYQLIPLDQYLSEIKTKGRLSALQSDDDIKLNGYNYSQQIEGLVEELQKAYLYIEELNQNIEELKTENTQLKDLMRRIEIIENQLR